MNHNELRETHIVFGGNLPLTPRNQTLFTEKAPKVGRKLALKGIVGAPVAFTLTSAGEYRTVDDTDIPTLKTPLYLGKFVDPYNNGFATDVQLIAGEKLGVCDLNTAYSVKPTCGSPTIVATSIDCVECQKSYSAVLSVKDNKTISFALPDKGVEYFATHHTQCNSCGDDCDPVANCKDIAHGIVDQLNGTEQISIAGNPYPDYKASNYNLPKNWRAVVGHSTWKTYCISPDPGTTCTECTSIDKITTATIDGTSYTFVNNENPAAPLKTLVAQLEGLAQQIEDVFEERIGKHSGFAFVTKGITSCCPIQLHVVTCDEDFAITGLTECPITPDMSYLPQVKWADCNSVAGTPTIPSCWIAVIGYAEKPDCDNCDINEPPLYPTIDLSLTFLKDDISDYSPIITTKTILEGTTPSNYGLEIRWLENKHNEPGGRGRSHFDTTSSRVEPYGNQHPRSKWKNVVTAKCDKMYCSIVLEYKDIKVGNFTNSPLHLRFKSAIHMESTGTTTINSVLPLLQAIVDRSEGTCRLINDLSCS